MRVMDPVSPCFNPRPREGATLAIFDPSARIRCFNPRPREGATIMKSIYHTNVGVSIHAPVKGRRYR